MNVADKLARLLPHWAEHSAEHVAEIRDWRRLATGEVGEAVIVRLLEAEAAMNAAQSALEAAVDALAAANAKTAATAVQD
jgi:hypothetical protein